MLITKSQTVKRISIKNDNTQQHPHFNQAMGICGALFFDSFQDFKGNFNYFSYNAFKHVVNLCLNDFGILGFRFLEEKIRTTHETISDLKTKPYRLYDYLKSNTEEFKEYLNKHFDSIKEKINLLPTKEFIPVTEPLSRAIPNVFLRSALFGIQKKGVHLTVKNKEILSMSQYQVLFSGEELNQMDLIVWDALVYLFKQKSTGSNRVRVTIFEVCKFLGYVNSQETRDQVKNRIFKLVLAVVQVKGKQHAMYMSHLIQSFALIEDEPNAYHLEFDNHLLCVFRDTDDYTFININIRKQLGQNQLALWIFHFYASHKEPIPFSLEYLHDLSRSGLIQKEFNRALRSALELIKNAYVTENSNFEYKIENSKLFVRKDGGLI
jgi:hypothetical protein